MFVDGEQASLTPMMKQYFEIKQKASDAILLFRMGDFYEIFGSDALDVAPKLELVLTSRERGKDQERIPFCGVPHHAVKNYCLKLLKLGYKVALADQLEDPSQAKGIVKRDIVRVLTPGCIDEIEGLQSDEPNYLMAIFQNPTDQIWAVAVADVSTGEMRCGNCSELTAVASIIEKFKPAEIITRKFLRADIEETLAAIMPQHRVIVGEMAESILRDEVRCNQVYQEVFGSTSFSAQLCGKVSGGSEIIAGLIQYLMDLKSPYTQFLNIKPLIDAECMILDEIAVRDLEIFETVRRRSKEGSLFSEINRTVTAMGARLLRESLAFPLLDQEHIYQRQEAVQALAALDSSVLEKVRKSLNGIADLERLAIRILSKRAMPVELIKVKDALAMAGELHAQLQESDLVKVMVLDEACKALISAHEPYMVLADALSGVTSILGTSLDIFREGFDSILDAKRNLARDGQHQIDQYEMALKQQTGINSLKIRQHKTFGLLIDITKANLAKVPAHFIRRQTMVNGERFATSELQDLSDALTTSHEDAIAREGELFGRLLDGLSKYVSVLQEIARAVAILDLMQSFAFKARESAYFRPRLAGHDEGLVLKDSRHPVVERYVGRNDFVPNDLSMNLDKKYVLITGPNMAGKSTIMRQVAICAIMHQVGSFVPARSAIMPVFDRIFTRVGAADDLARGQSTFMVEMSEAAHILREATGRSLVILDEVGRGTSTQDGLALASAILEDLVETVQCFTLFATHYHELVPLAEKFKSIEMLQTEVVERSGRIHFTHRIIGGASGSSFGIEVARIAGVPQRVIKKAGGYLNGIAPTGIQRVAKGHAKEEKLKEAAPSQAALALGPAIPPLRRDTDLSEIITKLETLKIHRTTPLQALNILNDLKGMLCGARQSDLFPDQGAIL